MVNFPSSKLLVLALVLLACLTLSTYAQSTNLSCTINPDDLTNILSYLEIYVDSGATLNDIGNYQACTASTTSTYFLGNIYNGTNTTSLGYVGLCVPSDCTAALVDTGINYLLQNIPSAQAYNIQAVDPSSALTSDNNFYFYFIVIVLVIFTILVIVGTFQPYAGINWRDDNSQDNSSILNNGNVDNYKSFIVKKLDPTPLEIFFDCFNASKNFKKLFSTGTAEGHDTEIGVFNGIRTLSYFYVIYGHDYLIRGETGVIALEVLAVSQQTVMSFVSGAFYSVDCFFFLGGFLTAFVMTDKLRKMGPSVSNYLMLIFQRYIRIMPLYLTVIFIYWKLSVLIGSGPIRYLMVDSITSSCNDSWWQHLFFGDNFGAIAFDYQYCFGWGWYLACDFQVFLFTPLFLWLYVKNANLGKLAITAFLIVLLAASFVVTFVDKITSFPVQNWSPDNSWYYYMPYTRAPPYVLGLLFSLIYKELKLSKNPGFFINLILESRIFRIAVSFVGIGIILFITWIVTPLLTNYNAWPLDLQYTFSAISRTLFVFGLALFLLPSLFGKNRFFTGMMNNGFFTVMARISYGGYLVQYMVLQTASSMSKGNFVATNLDIFYDWCTTVVISSVLSIILILLVEAPFVNIELTYLRKRNVKKIQNVDENPLLKTINS